MKRLLGLGVLALAGSIGSAQAAVITFEDIAVGVGVDSFHAGASDPVSGGFLFDASNHSHIANAAWATDNGGTYLVVDDVLGPDVLTISPQAGGAFALTSIDISEAHFSTSIFARQVQVVGNLFTNVRVHTPVDAGLEVRLSSRDGRAELEVVDHGPGISAEHADQVFDRFYRADPGRSRDRGGSGLGLAIAASVVEAHGGSVVHRPTPGGGATFAVTLPIAHPAVPARVA